MNSNTKKRLKSRHLDIIAPPANQKKIEKPLNRKKLYENPITVALNRPYQEGMTVNRHIKPLPTLPPKYEQKLHDLDPLIQELHEHRMNLLEEEEKKKRFQLKIPLSAVVKPSFSDDLEAVAITRDEKSKKVSAQKKDLALKKQKQFLEDSSYATRNVPYMLDVFDKYNSTLAKEKNQSRYDRSDSRTIFTMSGLSLGSTTSASNHRATQMSKRNQKIVEAAKIVNQNQIKKSLSDEIHGNAMDALLDDYSAQTLTAMKDLKLSSKIGGALSHATVSLLKERITKSLKDTEGADKFIEDIFHLILTGNATNEMEEEMALLQQRGEIISNVNRKGHKFVEGTTTTRLTKLIEKSNCILLSSIEDIIALTIDENKSNVTRNTVHVDEDSKIKKTKTKSYHEETTNSSSLKEIIKTTKAKTNKEHDEIILPIARFLMQVNMGPGGKPFHEVLHDVRTLSNFILRQKKGDGSAINLLAHADTLSFGALDVSNAEEENEYFDSFNVINIELFNEALHSTDSKIQFAAARLLLYLQRGKDELVPIFETFMRNGTENDQITSALCLAQLGHYSNESLKLIVPIIGESSTNGVSARRMLGDVEEEYVDLVAAHVVESLKSSICSTRIHAIKILTKLASEKRARSGLSFPDDLVAKAIPALKDLFWNDWKDEAQMAASDAIVAIQDGKTMVQILIDSLYDSNAVRRIEGLKLLAKMKILTRRLLAAYIECFTDDHVNVRIEACKTAYCLKSSNSKIVNAIVATTDDFNPKARAYALKALGSIGCKEENVLQCILWVLEHDAAYAVRCQACKTVMDLNIPISGNLVVRAESKQEKRAYSAKKDREDEDDEPTYIFQSPLHEAISVAMHILVSNDPSKLVRDTAEGILRKLDAYHYDLNLSSRTNDSATIDPNFFTDEQQVIKSVKDLTTKESVTQYIMYTC